MSRLLIVAGDASGDLHAAALVRSLRERRGDLRLTGLGGPAMQKAGVELVGESSALAVGGLLELAGSARRIVETWRTMDRALSVERPDLVVLVSDAHTTHAVESRDWRGVIAGENETLATLDNVAVLPLDDVVM